MKEHDLLPMPFFPAELFGWPSAKSRVYDGCEIDTMGFLASMEVALLDTKGVGLLMRELHDALQLGDVAALRRHRWVGRLLRRPMPRSRISKVTRRRIFARDGNHCLQCGTHWFLEVDHIKPVVYGGGDEDENLQTLCRKCNKAKGPPAYAHRRIEVNA